MNLQHSSESSNSYNVLLKFRKNSLSSLCLTVHALIILETVQCNEPTLVPGPSQQEVVTFVVEILINITTNEGFKTQTTNNPNTIY